MIFLDVPGGLILELFGTAKPGSVYHDLNQKHLKENAIMVPKRDDAISALLEDPNLAFYTGKNVFWLNPSMEGEGSNLRFYN